MVLLELEDVHNDVLHGISLAAEAGECVGLSGPSGAGKSRLLRALADLDLHQGAISLAGRPQAAFPPSEWRRRVGLLPAESRWWGETVAEHFPEGFADAGKHELKGLGFGVEVLNWEVGRLSSGEKQRLALLRLLANRPSVLLLDEPTANLDPANTERMEALLLHYMETTPAVLVWVSHSPDQLRRVASRQYRIEQGRLRAVTAA